MSLQYGILGILNYADMTGYELGKAFDASLSYFWQAQTSQIYRELNKMEESKWLTSRIEVQTDKPNKRIYSITETGKEKLQNWLQGDIPKELIPTRSELLMRLFFSAQNDVADNIKTLRTIAENYRRQGEEMAEVNDSIAEYQSFAKSKEDLLYWDMTAEFGRAYSNMCQEWAAQCIKRLEEYNG